MSRTYTDAEWTEVETKLFADRNFNYLYNYKTQADYLNMVNYTIKEFIENSWSSKDGLRHFAETVVNKTFIPDYKTAGTDNDVIIIINTLGIMVMFDMMIKKFQDNKTCFTARKNQFTVKQAIFSPMNWEVDESGLWFVVGSVSPGYNVSINFDPSWAWNNISNKKLLDNSVRLKTTFGVERKIEYTAQGSTINSDLIGELLEDSGM